MKVYIICRYNVPFNIPEVVLNIVFSCYMRSYSEILIGQLNNSAVKMLSNVPYHGLSLPA